MEMEDVTREAKTESGKDEKKHKRGKSKISGTKTKMKKSKSPPAGGPHSKGGYPTEGVTSARDNNSAVRADESLPTVTPEDAVRHEVCTRARVSEESPLKRGDHSKSRSRSESRSRFSGFFKRKKRSKSETDLNQGAQDEAKKRCDSAEDVKRKQAPDAAFQASDSLDCVSFTPRTNMKRISPHHYYDSRIQPRDRLKNMTVRDAVKEQRLRRVDSASRSPRRRRHDYNDDVGDSMSGLRASSSEVKFALDAKDKSPSAQKIPIQKTSTLPKAAKPGTWQPDLESSAFKKYSSNPEFNPTVVDSSSTNKIDHFTSDTTADVASTDSFNERGSINDSIEDFRVYSSLNKAADLEKYKISPHADLQNDGEDTKTLVNVSISSQEDEQKDPENKINPTEAAGVSANKSKRKESLSKFLELRQHPPSLLSRYRSSSQSSDSGVTSRETSPANAAAHRTARPTVKSKVPNGHERLSPARPTDGKSEAEKSSNPYVVSSVPIPTPSVITPRLSLNGTELDTENIFPPPVRPTNIKLDDSQGEASSVSSSPQVSSMTSSFRSSDQGYDESGSGDSSDENSAFSTPPEESESNGDKTKHIFSPGMLEKALLTSGESRNQNRKFRELDLETWNKKQPKFCIDKECESLTSIQSVDIVKGNTIEKDSLAVGQRYIPRGVRRSKSDVSARYQSPRRLFRNTSGSGAQSPAAANQSYNGSLDAVTYPPSISSKFDEDRCSATSISTLTNFDIYTHRGAQNGFERSEQKNLPVMGTTAQQKYRRTFSPSGGDKLTLAQTRPELLSQVIVIPSEEPTSLPSNISPASTPLLNVPSSDNASRQTPSPNIPRRGILKTISKERSDILKNAPGGSSPREITSSPYTTEKRENSNSFNNSSAFYGVKTDLPPSYPDIEIRLGNVREAKQPVVVTHENSTHEMGKPERNSFNATVAQETSPKIQPSPNLQAVAPKPVRQNSLPLFPVFHGLEIGVHKDPVVSNYSLADFLQEQSVAKWNKQVTGKEQKEVENTDNKKVKGWRKSFKRKSKKEVSELKRDKKNPKSLLGVNEDSDQIRDRKSQVSELRLKNIDEGKFTVMVDKECQTSSWLINSIVSKKTPKLRKKALSVKKKKRRGSVVSDTFVPHDDAQRHKDAHHRSSLGDLRKLPVTDTDFTKDHARIISLSSQLGRSPSVKRVTKKTGILRPEPVLAGTSHRSDTSRSEEAQELPKPKKLSLTAVILLKNRLARFREKKRKEKENNETRQEEELVESEVPSDTFVTIENELNLSKLEVSKETDIIDDIFEPEFSLDYNRKHLRFDPMISEPMQSEEPLPPLLPSSSRRLRQRRESTMRERRRKCVHYCKKFIAFLFSHIGLCSLVVAYTIMGGVIFQALEDTADHSVRSGIRERREKVVGQLIALAVEFQKTESGMDNLSSEVNYTVLEYQEFIHRQTKEKGWDGVEGANEESLWTFASSLLYAITVTTTIGYGHVAPKTPEGRIVTIGYAVIGIPLTLLCLTNIGDVMATGFRLLYGKVCCGVCCTLFKPRRRRIPVDLEKGLGQPLVTTEEEQPDKPKEVIHVPTSLCLLLIAAYIFAGAMLFSMWESWDILTGSYFCFITLSTIGFGDIVPGMDSNAWAHEEKLVLCALYLVLGLSLIAMCFNLVQEDVKAKCRWLGMKLGIVEKPEAPI